MMDVSNQPRGRGGLKGGRPHSRNKRWVSGQDHANHGNDGERWERGGHRKPYGGRGSHSGRNTPHLTVPQNHEDPTSGEEEGAETDAEVMEDNSVEEEELPLSATQAQRETFYQHVRAWSF
ncbi:hypothetical protein C8Q75DRAFT_67298 [Abortiporus biennis]|nr:hypothetical protein C8Q75DRAFT_67298 [Abortiporus biennis]